MQEAVEVKPNELIYTLNIGPGTFANDGDVPLMTAGERMDLLRNALNDDPEITGMRGLAEYVDDSFQDVLDYIVFQDCFLYEKDPWISFSIGVDPLYLEGDETPILEYVKDFMLDQIENKWGINFSGRAILKAYNGASLYYEPFVEGVTKLIIM